MIIERTTDYIPKLKYATEKNWNQNKAIPSIDAAVSQCLAGIDPAKVEKIDVERMEAASKVRFRVVVTVNGEGEE